MTVKTGRSRAGSRSVERAGAIVAGSKAAAIRNAIMLRNMTLDRVMAIDRAAAGPSVARKTASPVRTATTATWPAVKPFRYEWSGSACGSSLAARQAMAAARALNTALVRADGGVTARPDWSGRP